VSIRTSVVSLLLAVSSSAVPGSGSGQSVRGRLLEEGSRAPLAGAHVVLEAPDGSSVAAAVSGPEGSFELVATAPGTYKVRGDPVGYLPALTEVRLDGASLEVEITSRRVVIPLDDMSTDMGRPCRIPPRTAARVAALWAEVAKALRVAVLVQERGQLGFEVATWYRQLDPRRLGVVEEARTSRPGFHPTAQFPSPPAAELVAQGYVQGGEPGQSLAFYGPDARTLMEGAFIATHCMGYDDDAPDDGWVGLTFRPLDDDTRDVEGTLWIDAVGFEPRVLEYRFTELPWPIKTDKVGGRAEFRRLSTGALIVDRWWKRMPRVGVRQQRITPWAEPSDRYTLEGVVEEGGEILRVRTPDGRIEVLR
jgi:hypothetical protein